MILLCCIYQYQDYVIDVITLAFVWLKPLLLNYIIILKVINCEYLIILKRLHYSAELFSFPLACGRSPSSGALVLTTVVFAVNST